MVEWKIKGQRKVALNFSHKTSSKYNFLEPYYCEGNKAEQVISKKLMVL